MAALSRTVDVVDLTYDDYEDLTDTRSPLPMAAADRTVDLTSDANEDSTEDRSSVIVPAVAAESVDKLVKKEISDSAADKTADSDDGSIDDGDCCPICFENWTQAGEHRLCALRCGHVFGHSCIVRWMNTSQHICPTCKDKIHKHDVRFIYAKKLIALDTVELENTKLQLQDALREQTRLTMELHSYRLKENQWLLRQKELEAMIESLQESLRRRPEPALVMDPGLSQQSLNNTYLSAPTPYMQQERRYNLYKDKTLEITRDGGCRSVVYHSARNLLAVSAKRVDNLFPGYGISLVDITKYKVLAYHRLHSLEIRDMVYHPSANTLATVSIDKSFKILDFLSNNVIARTFITDTPLWSCCWDVNNPYIAYIGTQNGTIHQLDQRSLQVPVSSFSVSDDFGAVLSLQTLQSNPMEIVAPLGGLAVCKLNSCWLFENHGTSFRQHKLAGPGPYFSMCIDQPTRHFFLSSRPRGGDNPQEQYIKHTLFNMQTINASVVPNVVHTYHGGFVQTKISRPCFNTLQNDMCVTAYHETDRRVYLWSVNTGRTIGFVPAQENVMGIAAIPSTQSVVTLTDRKIDVYKFVL